MRIEITDADVTSRDELSEALEYVILTYGPAIWRPFAEDDDYAEATPPDFTVLGILNWALVLAVRSQGGSEDASLKSHWQFTLTPPHQLSYTTVGLLSGALDRE